jgi:uncharacterized protein VirK/YbjX
VNVVNLYQWRFELERLYRGLVETIALKWRKAQLAPYFDEKFYRFCYGEIISDSSDALDHYLTDGCKNRFDPNPDFSTRDYLEDYPDLSHAGDALYDYLRSGKAAGRAPQPSRQKVEYFTAGEFDAGYYLAMNADVRGEWSNPLKHYVELGWREGRDPSPRFSTRYYLDRYVDARDAGVNPLYHYVRIGRGQGRQQSAVPNAAHAVGPHARAQTGTGGRSDSLFSRYLHSQPQFATKWLRPNYLATGFSELQRAKCFMFHYHFMMDVFGETFLDDLFFGSVEIWARDIDGARHSIAIKQSRTSLVEGELSLEFQVDALCLYTVSFTIAPADLAGAGDEGQVLISRVQGSWGLWPQIKQATRRMKDVSPSFALIAALQGLASATGIHRLGGVSALYQPARASTYKSDFDQAYDQFFRSLGAEPLDDRLFSACLPLAEKPMTEVKPGHRIRTRAKRAIKHEIAEAAAAAIGERLVRRALSPSPAPPQLRAFTATSAAPALTPPNGVHPFQFAKAPNVRTEVDASARG